MKIRKGNPFRNFTAFDFARLLPQVPASAITPLLVSLWLAGKNAFPLVIAKTSSRRSGPSGGDNAGSG
jgi:hypothetical protein